MEVWKFIFLSKWVICRFHVNHHLTHGDRFQQFDEQCANHQGYGVDCAGVTIFGHHFQLPLWFENPDEMIDFKVEL